MEQKVKVKVYLAVFWDSEAWRALQSEWPHYFFELRNIAQPSVLLMQDCMGPATSSIIIFNYFHREMSKLRHYSISRKRQFCLCRRLIFCLQGKGLYESIQCERNRIVRPRRDYRLLKSFSRIVSNEFIRSEQNRICPGRAGGCAPTCCPPPSLASWPLPVFKLL